MKHGKIELSVGIFIIIAVFSLILLAFQVSGLKNIVSLHKTYLVTSVFDNVGSLKVRSPVTISGVKVGEVNAICLNQKTFQAIVVMRLASNFNQIPEDTSARIYTTGLVGENYIDLSPGYAKTFLQDGSRITNTQPALVLENLISQYLFSIKK